MTFRTNKLLFDVRRIYKRSTSMNKLTHIAATRLIWTTVIFNSIEASEPLSNGRALILKWCTKSSWRGFEQPPCLLACLAIGEVSTFF